ncbi:putative FkbP-type 22 kDa peptidyl-pro [Ostreococcus tauri]|uniref:peptidylprolyl isomerase n=1 Tax=Ostreococcus tauri TaxID=70448 RepID=A0A1Y5IJ81_OSTTA|nr:putative FkbP-type 22 kDa peptidyl-pro [Ostreococcus tauri]
MSRASASLARVRDSFDARGHRDVGRRLRARASRASDDAAARTSVRVNIEKPMGMTLEPGSMERGTFVAGVGAGSNADAAGVKAGDVFVRVHGKDARGMAFDDLLDAIGSVEGAVEVELARFPGGREQTTPRDRAWLEANSTREDVVTLPSGLQYRVIESGTGRAGIKMETACECHYAGTLIDGTEFDSSYRRGKPLTFAPRQVIKAWQEAMRRMREGDKWEIFCPSELAYGARGSGRFIKPGDALVFTMSIERVLG